MKNKQKSICTIDLIGTKRWSLNGLLHREDGPTIEWHDGGKEWYINNQRHREDGPAIEWANGKKYWWLNGWQYTEEDYYKELFKMGKITEKELFIELI
jgi:hypothetical protein